MFKKFVYIIILLLNHSSFAAVPTDGIVKKCSLTPQIKNLQYAPDDFNLTNNLRRKNGQFKSAEGKNIIIFGRIFDKNCIPVSDAKIEVWQANNYGLYQYGTPESKNQDNRAKLLFDPNFVGSGTLSSNNMGRYHFLSIKPGRYEDHTPHINFRISYPNMKTFETKMYFSDEIDNISDKSLSNIDSEQRYKLIAVSYTPNFGQEDQSGPGEHGKNSVYLFDIILDIELANKSY